eukprot:TRINITY_DN7054_c0_g1_i6.p2 TRINITY_DN7054_c0_g1~~TRINITY_DN7054_c0_g1_i6.p2  ORF type:complete len:209 (-),score=22.61 TRINITY_DN7054_c0_g1_i6:260-886(-)
MTGFDAVKPFTTDDLAIYISAPWYIQEQVPLSYQPLNELFCVRAEYTAIDEKDFSKGITVINYSNKDKVNGVKEGGIMPLIAIVRDLNQASKLRVGRPQFFEMSETRFGNYWIVAIGRNPDNTQFEWAIVSAGPPTRKTSAGCATGSEDEAMRKFQVNDFGLWLFTREKVASEETIQLMKTVAQEKGFDISELVKVQQEGCQYIGIET